VPKDRRHVMSSAKEDAHLGDFPKRERGIHGVMLEVFTKRDTPSSWRHPGRDRCVQQEEGRRVSAIELSREKTDARVPKHVLVQSILLLLPSSVSGVGSADSVHPAVVHDLQRCDPSE
jgi:hypothetical protein